MLRRVTFLTSIVFLCACSAEEAARSPCPEGDTSTATLGEQAYLQACARCHDDGVDGAPRLGDRDAWAGRSWLWEAVLFEHATKGYVDMPAKGGDESLDDETVERAAEYMLCVTFPDVPRD